MMSQNEPTTESERNTINKIKDFLLGYIDQDSAPYLTVYTTLRKSKETPRVGKHNIEELADLASECLFSEDSEDDLETAVDALRGLSDIDPLSVLTRAFELEKSDVDPAPEGSPLDKYAFSDERMGRVPREKNNKTEKDLYDELSSYVRVNSPVSQESVSVIKNALSQGLYSDMFSPPVASEVHRGMSVSEEYLRAALGVKRLPSENGKSSKGFTFLPYDNRNVSGWTTDENVAYDFSVNAREDYSVVMTAPCGGKNSGSFLELSEYDYDVLHADHLSFEREVMGLNEIHVSKIEWEKIS
jgi:hypothetical protein